MIEVYKFGGNDALASFSPFCLKVEAWMRMVGMEYEVRIAADPRKAPKGKLPYILDGGKAISDSSNIIEYLSKSYGHSPDADLTPRQRALGLAVTRMVEEHLYFCLVYSRWLDSATAAITREAVLSNLPRLFRRPVMGVFQRQLRRDLKGQGVGRHSREDIFRRGAADIRALAELLGEGPYFFGDKPHGIDATLYAFVAQLVIYPVDTPLRAAALKADGLEAYTLRLHELWFGQE